MSFNVHQSVICIMVKLESLSQLSLSLLLPPTMVTKALQPHSTRVIAFQFSRNHSDSEFV